MFIVRHHQGFAGVRLLNTAEGPRQNFMGAVGIVYLMPDGILDALMSLCLTPDIHSED